MKNKPRIAVIGLKGLPAFGGAAAVGENIIEQLKDRYDFTVLSVASHTSKENTNINGVKQVVFRNFGKGGLNTFIYYWQCFLYAFFRKYDLIHLHHAESGFITPFLRLRFKVIVTFHGIYNYENPKFNKIQNSFFRFSEKLNTLFANEIISVSYPDYMYFKQNKSQRIHYIPNGISLTSSLNDVLNYKRQGGYLLFAAGRIYEIKGLHLLLSALKLLNITMPVKIAGDINQVEDYKDLIKKLSDGLNIEYLGLIKDKVELMELVAGAELFIFPSLAEAMSMMLLEVVSMKTPVLASDIPSNKAIFDDEELLFFKSESIEDLSKKLAFALENPDIMKRKSLLAYEKLIREYCWTNIALQYFELFEKQLK